MKIIIPLKFELGPYKFSTLAWGDSSKSRPDSITITTGEGKDTYKVCDGLASSKCKEIADALGIDYKSSWFAEKIAQTILTKVLGDSYNKPPRGIKARTFNAAIFDDFVLLHAYYNNGYGFADSISKSCYVFKK